MDIFKYGQDISGWDFTQRQLHILNVDWIQQHFENERKGIAAKLQSSSCISYSKYQNHFVYTKYR
jgi:hypothetical protein